MNCLVYFTDAAASQARPFIDLLASMMVDHEARPVGSPVAPQDLLDAQTARLIVVAGSGQEADILRSIASARGVLVDGPLDQPRALLGRIGVLLGRPGLGGWLAAREAGSAHLVEWSRANPEDPLAHSAALGVDPARLTELIAEAANARQQAASPAPAVAAGPEDTAQPTGDQAAIGTEDRQPEDDLVPEPGNRWRPGLPYGAVAAAIVALPLSFISLTTTDFSLKNRLTFLALDLVIALLLGASAVLALRWSPLASGNDKRDRRFLFVAKAAVIGAGLTAVVLTIVALIAWLAGETPKADIVGALILIVVAAIAALVVGGIANAIALLLVLRVPLIKDRAFVVLAIAVAITAGILLLYETRPQREVALQAELKRAGLARCDLGENEEIIRNAERRLKLPVTGKYSRALFRAAKAMPDKTEWVLARDGSGDGANLSEILPYLCSANADKPAVLRIRPGTYAMPAESYLNADAHIVGDDDRDKVIITVTANSGPLSLIGASQLRNLTVRAAGRTDGAVVSLSGTKMQIDNVVIQGNTLSRVLDISGEEIQVTNSVIRNAGKGSAMGSGAPENSVETKITVDNTTIAGTDGLGIDVNDGVNLRLRKVDLSGQINAVGNAKVTVEDSEIVGQTGDRPPLYAAGKSAIAVSGSTLRSNRNAYCAWATDSASIGISQSNLANCAPTGAFAHADKSATLRLDGNSGQRVTRDRMDVAGNPSLDVEPGRSAEGQRSAPQQDEPSPVTEDPAPVTRPQSRGERSSGRQIDYTE